MQNKSPKRHRRNQPPVFAERLLLLFTPAAERDSLAGDLAEEYARYHLPRSGPRRARRWYRTQVLRSLVPGLRRPTSFRRRPPRDIRGEGLMRDLLNDIRYGVRGLIQAPTFSLLTVLTLTLAIGVNSAIFSMVSAVFIADLPVDDTERVVFVNTRDPQRGAQRNALSLEELLDVRERVAAYDGVAALRETTAVLTGVDGPERVRVIEATTDLFGVWGTTPLRGRVFAIDEGEAGAVPVAMITHASWQARFGANPDIVGEEITLDGHATTIVGVLPSEVEFGDIGLAEIWIPLAAERGVAPRDQRSLFVTARLRDGATVEEANQQLAAVNERARTEFPEATGAAELYSQSFMDGLADDSFWAILTLLALTVVLVMLIACSNVATMLLARGSVRARELAVRSALGAGRWRIVRQLLTESAILSLLAGALGLLTAHGSLTALTWFVGETGESAGFFRTLSIDRNVLGFTVGVALAAPLLFALVPALRAVRREVVETLKEGSPAGGGVNAVRGRRVLVGVQVSLALILMAVAGLLIDAMMRARALDPGFDTRSVLTMRVDLPEERYSDPGSIAAFRRAVSERVARMPGVRHAAWIDRRNLADGGRGFGFMIEGRPEPPPEEVPWGFRTRVEPAYFTMVGIAAVRGRLIDDRDDESGAPIAVINQAAAERYWPESDPVGTRIRAWGGEDDSTWLEIVGIATNSVYPDPETPSVPEIYLPVRSRPQVGAALVVAADGDPMQLAVPVREAVWAIDPEQPVSDVRTIARIHADELASMNAVIGMFGAFALFALVMAAGGIYGVLSFAVAQRTREFGIRMALGARGGAVRRMVIRHSAVLILGGIVTGLLGAFALGRVLAAGLPLVEANALWVYGAVAAVLTAVAAISVWIPALRATRVDPMIALRTE